MCGTQSSTKLYIFPFLEQVTFSICQCLWLVRSVMKWHHLTWMLWYFQTVWYKWAPKCWWGSDTDLTTDKTYVNILYQFSSVAQLCPTLWDPMNHSTPGLPVHHQLPEFTQTHVHWVGDAIQPSHPLLSPSPPALGLSQHQGLFKWVSSSHQVAKVLEFQLQHQSFQWTPRTDLL